MKTPYWNYFPVDWARVGLIMVIASMAIIKLVKCSVE